MMKTLTLLSVLLVPVLSTITASAKPALESMTFKCITRSPTTSFLLKTEGEEAVLTTVHHNGVGYMPIHEGIIVPNDLGYLKEVSSVLSKMGERNEFRFPLKKCKIYGPSQMSCSQGNTQVLGGTKMSGFYLSTSKLKTFSGGDEYDQIKILFSVHIDGFAPVQDIVMNYHPSECQMGF